MTGLLYAKIGLQIAGVAVSAEEKSAIILEILQEGKKVSEVAEEHGIHPNQILQWKKQALENMAELFKTERKDITAKKEQREISKLKSELANAYTYCFGD